MATNEIENTLFSRGTALYELQNWDQAIECFNQLLDLSPKHNPAKLYLAHCYVNLSQPRLSRKYFTQLLESNEYQVPAVLGLLQNICAEQVAGNEVSIASQILSSGAVKFDQQIQLNFALGKRFEITSDYEQAFKYFKEANDLKQISSNYNAKRHTAYIDRIISVFDQKLFNKTEGMGIASDLPVFLVGTPRAGKSITEHLLNNNPLVFGAGEIQYLPLDGISELERRLQQYDVYPESLHHIQKQDAVTIAQQYLSIIEPLAVEKTQKVLDTMPGNLMNMGTISILFPNASTIFCSRNEMDTAVEIYFKNFAHGHDYASNLSNIASYIDDYRRLQEHWLNILPIKMTELKYEHFTQDPIATTQQLFNFLDINSATQNTAEWNYYEGKAINQNQVDYWKNYEAFLDPIKEKLLIN